MPQGSALGTLLFIIYVNNLDNGVKGKLSKFSDDGGDQIQEIIDACIDWAKDWQMQFNLNKCKVLDMGKKK